MTDPFKPTRRAALGIAAAAAASLAARPAAAASDEGVTVGDDGLFKQDWFLDSFLDIGDDLAEAAAAGKGLIVIFEQRGCPYCRELHRVNFQRKEIVEHLNAHYNVVQLDIFGAREATDFDGEAMEERRLAGRWGVHFTPTTVIFPPTAAGAESRADAEAFRLPGYLKPFHYLSALEYITTGAYRDQNFQRFLQVKFEALREKGIEPDVW